VINHDDRSYKELLPIISETGIPAVTYGVSSQPSYRADNIKYDLEGTAFDLIGPDHGFRIKTKLIGDYNVSNCLAAAAVCLEGLGLGARDIQQGVLNLAGIPGRMETFEMGQDFLAIVDFAHTPNALKRAITAARGFTKGRVITVFGSAGLRDREKRRLMAQVSGELADLTVLTAEDPRTESLDEILEEMGNGILSRGGVEGKTFWKIRDRGEAIRFSLDLAVNGDVILVCGKGHEQSMCFGMTEYPWDDRIALQAALADYLGVEGPDMPYLPTQV
jgi:UDP-N-acetylmuramoyl-L-alanyl-D-glutamate--2,6-diaminopimelate ligase